MTTRVARTPLAVALVVLAVLLLFVGGGPVLLLGIDLLWLVVIGTLSAVGRIVLRRPWSVEALVARRFAPVAAAP